MLLGVGVTGPDHAGVGLDVGVDALGAGDVVLDLVDALAGDGAGDSAVHAAAGPRVGGVVEGLGAGGDGGEALAQDGGLKVGDGGEDATPDAPAGQGGEEVLDSVEP